MRTDGRGLVRDRGFSPARFFAAARGPSFSSQAEGKTLKGSTLARMGRSSMPPGAAKMASAGTALARSMSCAFILRFSSGPSLFPAAALPRS